MKMSKTFYFYVFKSIFSVTLWHTLETFKSVWKEWNTFDWSISFEKVTKSFLFRLENFLIDHFSLSQVDLSSTVNIFLDKYFLFNIVIHNPFTRLSNFLHQCFLFKLKTNKKKLLQKIFLFLIIPSWLHHASCRLWYWKKCVRMADIVNLFKKVEKIKERKLFCIAIVEQRISIEKKYRREWK